MEGYMNLKGELAKNGITNTRVADVLGVHVNTVANKLDGASTFSVDEAFKIKSALLPYCDIGYLFARPLRPDDHTA